MPKDITPTTRPIAKRRKPVDDRLRKLLTLVFALLALLGVNSVYLAAVSAADAFAVWQGRDVSYQNYFYQWMFLVHLVLGIIFTLPLVIFGVLHIRNARSHPNKRAITMGYTLFAAAIIVLITGFGLARLDIAGRSVGINDQTTRTIVYVLHVAAPIAAVWLYILHRLAGRRIKWKIGLGWAAAAAAFAALAVVLHGVNPQQWGRVGPESSQAYFSPSLARTADGNFIDPDILMMDRYCLECHPDTHAQWAHSAHRFSSFNNPAYLASILETRQVALARDGNVQPARFCAGCHDPVPFFSGAFDNPLFDNLSEALATDPAAQAGITCTSCHAITNINSTRGNADYTIEQPTHYPFATADSGLLRWINRQLVKANPEFHKRTFLKPLHESPEFCASCHKVHIPEELNHYKWLRGQNHYDTWRRSGVSGRGVTSWYDPPRAIDDCNTCHMPPVASNDLGSRLFPESAGVRGTAISNHLFPSANTGVPHLLGFPDWVNEAHDSFMTDSMRLDIFGIRDGGAIDSPIIAPLAPDGNTLAPQTPYLAEVVLRNKRVGHPFTQGTADSNEVWLETTLTLNGRVIASSGTLDPLTNAADPDAHFVNAFVIDRNGNRIDRRNVQDIFVALYNNQVPPGAASVIHYAFQLPTDAQGTAELTVALRYRKFDTGFVRFMTGDDQRVNDLPISTLARATARFDISASASAGTPANNQPAIPLWERWHDYAIGLFRTTERGSGRGSVAQADAAFEQVARLGRAEGLLGRARVALHEGRLDDAAALLNRASTDYPDARPWSVAWFTAQVNRQQGDFEAALTNLEALIAMRDTAEARSRGFDWSRNEEVHLSRAGVLFDLAKRRRDPNDPQRLRLLEQAIDAAQTALSFDTENHSVHYLLVQLSNAVGDAASAEYHQKRHDIYRPDDNARDAAVQAARRNYAAADRAANAVVIYPLKPTPDPDPDPDQTTPRAEQR